MAVKEEAKKTVNDYEDLRVEVGGEDAVLDQLIARLGHLLTSVPRSATRIALVDAGHQAVEMFQGVFPNTTISMATFAAVAFAPNADGSPSTTRVPEFSAVPRPVVLAAVGDLIRWCIHYTNRARQGDIKARTPGGGGGDRDGGGGGRPTYRAPALPQFDEAEIFRSLLAILPIAEATPRGQRETLLRMAFVGASAAWIEESLLLRGADLWAHYLEMATGKTAAKWARSFGSLRPEFKEGWKTYLARLELTARVINHSTTRDALSDEELVEAFISGLASSSQNHLAMYISATAPKTSRDVRRAAEEYAGCGFGRLEQPARRIPFRPMGDRRVPVQMVGEGRGGEGEEEEEGNGWDPSLVAFIRSEVQRGRGGGCYTCGEEGHHSRDCPKKTCHLCNSPEHLSHSCPRRYGQPNAAVKGDFRDGERA
jgi:hypothetical protein